MNGPVTETQWYIARDGKQHGPLTDVEMRTFVAHSYLRATDLIWRPGMSEWMPATQVFPAVFPQTAAPQPAPAAQQSASAKPAPISPTSDFETGEAEDAVPPRSTARKLMTAAAVIAVIGGGAFTLAAYREPLTALVTGSSAPPADTSAEPASEVPTAEAPPAAEPVASETAVAPPADQSGAPAATATDASTEATPPAAETETAALQPAEQPAAPPSIDGSQIDARLQKIPVWATLKKDYPDWYVGHIAAAEKMVADRRPESDVATHLTQGLVTLRRQNADKALLASPDKLRRVASAFLENLKWLQSQSVSACYGFISKGETSPAIVQLMQSPENATTFNAHVGAVFDAIADGAQKPTQHQVAVKSDYDILIKELGKIGWQEDDLKTFSNPRLLSKRPPEQVCKMVLDWFVAHLAVKDQAVQDRLLFETLKPVVTG